ncbi:tetratricopeptide repeat protein [Streptomyces javensis]|uniref:tetratricopeptide repeat protein n=1 Tax=Streptomyces javensis TaxID=114698 RepID=UPI0034029354
MTPLPEPPPTRPNTAFRRLRGQLSPSEFAASVRRAAREIGEQVSCDARYIGRVESGAIRCPNYAYERVFRHMFPGRTLTDLGFASRESVRGHQARGPAGPHVPVPFPGPRPGPREPQGKGSVDIFEESELLRRSFMAGGAAAAAVAAAPRAGTPPRRAGRRVGEAEAAAVEEAVRRIRVLDDRHGADPLYAHTAKPLSAAYALLDAGGYSRSIAERLFTGAGELAISVGWLAHDSGRLSDARSHYAEALATARVSGDAALEAHAFCNTAFLARDAGHPREAVRAAQAAQRVAERLASPRLLSLLALREAGGLAWLTDRGGCERALLRARTLFGRGPCDADPEWMSFFGEAELEGLEAQCWSALGDWKRAVEHARRAVALQNPHFTRNIALFTTELARDLVAGGAPDAAAASAGRALGLLDQVKSSRIRRMLDDTARILRPYGRASGVADFLARYETTAARHEPTARPEGAARPEPAGLTSPV